MPTYKISHSTHYHYSAPVTQSHHTLHLAPRAVAHQTNHHYALTLEPEPAARTDRDDYHGNPMTLVSVEDEHDELSIQAQSEVTVHARAPVDLDQTVPWDKPSADAAHALPFDVIAFTCPSIHVQATPALYDFGDASFTAGHPVLAAVSDVMTRIHEEFRFDNATTDVATPLSQVLAQKSGVCQDFAHLMIGVLRARGVPAKYVSGYILTHPPPGQEKLAGTDASHAWVAAWAPETGWVEFDPTNNLVNSDEMITTAHGRDFHDVSPVTGVLLGGGQHTVSVAVDVRASDD